MQHTWWAEEKPSHANRQAPLHRGVWGAAFRQYSQRKPWISKEKRYLLLFDSYSLGNKALHSWKINRTVSEQHRAPLSTCFPNSCLWGCWLASYLDQRLGTIFSHLHPAMLSLKLTKNHSPPSFPMGEGFASCPSCTEKAAAISSLCISNSS